MIAPVNARTKISPITAALSIVDAMNRRFTPQTAPEDMPASRVNTFNISTIKALDYLFPSCDRAFKFLTGWRGRGKAEADTLAEAKEGGSERTFQAILACFCGDNEADLALRLGRGVGICAMLRFLHACSARQRCMSTRLEPLKFSILLSLFDG